MDVGRICVYTWSDLMHLAALSSWWVCCVHVSRDCVTSVRSYSDPPPTTWERQ